MPIRQTFIRSVILDASGNGAVSYTATGDFLIQHAMMRVYPIPPATASNLIPTGETDLGGTPFEGSQTGNFDASDTQHLMLANDTITCTWTAGDPGATAVFTIRGIQYAVGEGIAATTGTGNAVR
jgi:hypothetical protein